MLWDIDINSQIKQSLKLPNCDHVAQKEYISSKGENIKNSKKKKSINIEPCQFDFNFYLVRDFGLENILPHKSQRAAFNIL